jgi:hypothetical protein
MLPIELLPENRERFGKWEEGLNGMGMSVVRLNTQWLVTNNKCGLIMAVTYNPNLAQSERFVLLSKDEPYPNF